MKIVIPVLVGASTGYFTNWLAIKMLFRPHYEKKILGIKLPFTPGLIPKEKKRIAKNIGTTVGQYLLSPQVIIETLEKQEVEEGIKKKLDQALGSLGNNSFSLKYYLEDLFKKDYPRYRTELERRLEELILGIIRKRETRELIFQAIEENIEGIEGENIYSYLERKIKGYLERLGSSGAISQLVKSEINKTLKDLSSDNRKLKEIIPEDLGSLGLEYIDRSQAEIGEFIRNTFNNPDFQRKLKDSISDAVDKNVSRLITTFIEADLIADKIFTVIEKYVYSENTDQYMTDLTKTGLETFLNSKSSQIIPRLYDNLGEERLNKIGCIIGDKLLKEARVESIIKLIRENLEEDEAKYRKDLRHYLVENIEKYIEGEDLDNKVHLILVDLLDWVLQKPLSCFTGTIRNYHIETIYRISKKIFNKLAVNHLTRLIELFNISRIVEEEIESFDVDFTEKLILDIAHKELKAITRLGALLGGLMGLLTPLFQQIY